jgi:glycosyltransferase involved in cell wall biosynthesis
MSTRTLPISIVIPVYNGATFLAEALESTLAQDPPPTEIIVVDDGSTDQPEKILDKYPQVDIVRQENRGVGLARNVGLQRASSPYILFLDHDDRLRPGALSHALNALQSVPEAAFSCGRSLIVSSDGVPWKSPNPLRPVVLSDHYRELLRNVWIVPPATVLFRRAALVECGGWSDRRFAEDYEVYLRLARQYPVVDHSNPIAEFRVHENNTTRDKAKLLAGITEVLDAERIHTLNDPKLERARRDGLLMWNKELGLRAAAQALARAVRQRQGVPRAAAMAVAAVVRHPVSFVRLVNDQRRRRSGGLYSRRFERL